MHTGFAINLYHLSVGKKYTKKSTVHGPGGRIRLPKLFEGKSKAAFN